MHQIVARASVTVVLLLATAMPPFATAADGDPWAELAAHVPASLEGTCTRLRPRDMAVSVQGAVAALVCTPDGPIEDVGLYLFDDSVVLAAWWDERLAMLAEPLGPGDCEHGVTGLESRVGGQLACYRSRGVARLRWIDEERLLYGSLDMTRPAIPPAYRWWAKRIGPCCGPLGRPSDPEAGPLLTWRRVDQAPGWSTSLDLSTPALTAVASAPDDGSVLLGHTYVGEPLAWFAQDGMDWSEVGMDGLLKGCRECTPGPTRKVAIPRDVAAWDAGFIAVGDADSRTRHDGAVWLSRTGTDWARPARLAGGSPRDVLVTDDGLAIVGVAGRQREDGRGIPTLWSSSDGRTWTAQPISEERAWVGSAARSPQGLWIVRGTGAWQGQGDARIWRSSDGVHWEELAVPAQDGAGDLMRLVGPVWTPTGFVIATNAVDRAGSHAGSRLWQSLDGGTWSLVAESDAAVGALASSAAASVAFPGVSGPDVGWIDVDARPEAHGAVLTSADGRSWCTSTADPFRRSGATDADMAPDGRVIAAGHGGPYAGWPRTWNGEPTTSVDIDCTPADPTDTSTMTSVPVLRDDERGRLRTFADLEASDRRTVTFDQVLADLEPLLDDPSTRSIARDRYWYELDDWTSYCRRAEGDERFSSCDGFLDVAISLYHYAPSEATWTFVRDAYDYVLGGLSTLRMRRFLAQDTKAQFDHAADEYAWGATPGDPGDR